MFTSMGSILISFRLPKKNLKFTKEMSFIEQKRYFQRTDTWMKWGGGEYLACLKIPPGRK